MTSSDRCLEIICDLGSKEKRLASLAEAFPIIHHFNATGGDASLATFKRHCENHEIEQLTNMNVLRRLEFIQRRANEYLSDPSHENISFLRFQQFSKEAVAAVPF